MLYCAVFILVFLIRVTGSKMNVTCGDCGQVAGGENAMEKWYNDTLAMWLEAMETSTPLSYRIIATSMHVAIFCCGVTGNVLLIIVVHKSKFLKSATYMYLVSLAFADLLVIITAIPEAIVFDQMGSQWMLGTTMCSLFVFLNFLGINAGSLSTLAFTVERYIGVCQPLYARKLCTLSRTKHIIIGLWILAVLYCCPWLGLTEVKSDDVFPFRPRCEMRLPSFLYIPFFGADLLFFYCIPLIVAVVVYTRIGKILYNSLRMMRQYCIERSSKSMSLASKEKHLIRTDESPGNGHEEKVYWLRRDSSCKKQMVWTVHSRIQVLRMLIVVVVLFAVSWLPFRGLLVYNAFVTEPWLNIWYLLFAKTLIYLNCAVNPFLYNAMSQRFRAAVKQVLHIKSNPRSMKLRKPLKIQVQRSLYRHPQDKAPSLLTSRKSKSQSDSLAQKSKSESSSQRFQPLWYGIQPDTFSKEAIEHFSRTRNRFKSHSVL